MANPRTQLTLQSLLAENKGSARVKTSKGNKMEALVHGIVGSNNPHVSVQERPNPSKHVLNDDKDCSPNHFFRKEQLLPGTAEMLRIVHHRHPMYSIQ